MRRETAILLGGLIVLAGCRKPPPPPPQPPRTVDLEGCRQAVQQRVQRLRRRAQEALDRVTWEVEGDQIARNLLCKRGVRDEAPVMTWLGARLEARREAAAALGRRVAAIERLLAELQSGRDITAVEATLTRLVTGGGGPEEDPAFWESLERQEAQPPKEGNK